MKQNVFSGYNKQNMYSLFFCSTLSEFEIFFLCERQANFKDFKRFGAFKGSSNKKKKTLYSTRSCVNWAFLALVGRFKRSFERFKGPRLTLLKN
jgi:hypothetical protein